MRRAGLRLAVGAPHARARARARARPWGAAQARWVRSAKPWRPLLDDVKRAGGKAGKAGAESAGGEGSARSKSVATLLREALGARLVLAADVLAPMGRRLAGSHLGQRLPQPETIRERIRKLDSSMEYNEYKMLRWFLGFGSVAAVLLYSNWTEVKMWFGSTGADITSRTLGDESVKREAQNLAQGVVYQLLNDAHALRLTMKFLNQLLEREDTRRAVLALLASVAARDETKVLFQDLFVRILTQPAFVAQTSEFVQLVLARDSSKEALKDVFAAVFADEAFQQLTAEFFQHVINTETFQNSVYELANDTTHSMLNDEQVAQHAIAWAQQALLEPDLHSKAGDAIWGALTATFIPGFLGGRAKKKSMVNIDEAIASIRKEQQNKTSAGKVGAEAEDTGERAAADADADVDADADADAGAGADIVGAGREEDAGAAVAPGAQAAAPAGAAADAGAAGAAAVATGAAEAEAEPTPNQDDENRDTDFIDSPQAGPAKFEPVVGTKSDKQKSEEQKADVAAALSSAEPVVSAPADEPDSESASTPAPASVEAGNR